MPEKKITFGERRPNPRQMGVLASVFTDAFVRAEPGDLADRLADQVGLERKSQPLVRPDDIRRVTEMRRGASVYDFENGWRERVNAILGGIQTPHDKIVQRTSDRYVPPETFFGPLKDLLNRSQYSSLFQDFIRHDVSKGSAARQFDDKEILKMYGDYEHNLDAFFNRTIGYLQGVTEGKDRDGATAAMEKFAALMFGRRWEYYCQYQILAGERKMGLINELKIRLPLPLLRALNRN
jgi:hypothetical protein